MFRKTVTACMPLVENAEATATFAPFGADSAASAAFKTIARSTDPAD